MEPKYKSGDLLQVLIGKQTYRFRITKADHFGSQQHYGFIATNEVTRNTVIGWMPVVMFEQFHITQIAE